MDFKKGSKYSRDDLHTLYFDKPVPKTGTGNWLTGYVQVGDDLLVFMNINVAGRTGHDFPNQFDSETKMITWYGKPNTHSEQPIFAKLIKKELTPHFFARWDSSDPQFLYLGIGKIIGWKDGHPTTLSDGRPASTIELKLICEDAEEILSNDETTLRESSFALEKHLEEFIDQNWDSLELGQKYDISEEVIDGKRKKFRTDTGEVDIFALSKDQKEFLVIELKRGRASDRVVGQIQRYMGYVKDEIANNDQTVKGLIIALEDDLSIRRALSINPNIEFCRYKISFDLISNG